MEDQEQSEPSNNGSKDKKHGRSASYPVLNLEGAITFTTKVYTTFSTECVTREEIAVSQSIHANTVSRPVAACVQFGLLSKATGDGYKVTELFIDIYKPENSKEKKIKLLTAFGTPKLYQDIIGKFDGHVIPNEFPNTLVRHHQITENAAENAADTFIESGKFAGAISESRHLKFKDTINSLSKMQFAIVEEVEAEESSNAPATQLKPINEGTSIVLNPNDKRVPIYLTKDKVAYFQYPANMSANDVALVKHNLDGILMRIKFEADENSPENAKSSTVVEP